MFYSFNRVKSSFCYDHWASGRDCNVTFHFQPFWYFNIRLVTPIRTYEVIDFTDIADKGGHYICSQ
jgi:hypothetical protein